MKLKPRHHRAAKAIGQGRGFREAGRRSGLQSKRAARGVSVAEWMRVPEFRNLVKKYAEAAMTGQEWDARNTLMARGELPTRYHWDGEGHLTGATGEAGKAMERMGIALGKLKDRHIFTGEDGGPIRTESQVTIYIPANGREKPEE